MTDTKTARNVLFVTSHRIGDCVISSGMVREIARQVPGARPGEWWSSMELVFDLDQQP